MNNVFIVIPAYNEGQVIFNVINKIKHLGYKKIIVVDDGSNDNTYEQAKKAKVIMLRHMLNRGKGAAVKTGLEAAKQKKVHIIVVTFDGDGQHDAQDIKILLRKIMSGYDVVLGSRLLKNKGMPFIKIVANYLGNIITWIMYGIYVTDSQCGLRAYSGKALEKINTNNDRYEFDSEIIREIGFNHLKYTEVPVKALYTKYSMNKTNKQSFINGLRTAFKIVFNN